MRHEVSSRPFTLTVWDELPLGEVVNVFELEVCGERLTARELIERRVSQEVQAYNLFAPGYFRGLVQPTEAEATLNGSKLRQRRKVDQEGQFRRALEAFERNGFFILVDDRQLDELDEVVEVTAESQVSFVRLVPLVGG